MSESQATDPVGWRLNPDYQIAFDPIPARVRTVFGGATIADSRKARVMYELGHAPIYYLPQADVAMAYLELTDRDTYCPYKGHACYWTVRVGEQVAENTLWAYPEPYPEMAEIAGYIGFYWGRMEAWYEDDEKVSGPREIPGRIDTTTQFKTLFPALAAEWHPTRNPGIKPYEFPAYSDAVVWWQDARGREWQERIRDRVLAATKLRAEGDATPYG